MDTRWQRWSVTHTTAAPPEALPLLLVFCPDRSLQSRSRATKSRACQVDVRLEWTGILARVQGGEGALMSVDLFVPFLPLGCPFGTCLEQTWALSLGFGAW